MWVCASLQSCDGSEFTLQGPAGGDDITGLSAVPAHYQLLSELGESRTANTSRSLLCIICDTFATFYFLCFFRKRLQQPEPGEHGTPHPERAAGGRQTNQPGRVHWRGAATAHGEFVSANSISCFCFLVSNCVFDSRTRFCSPGCSVTPTCWRLAWFSAPAASCGSSHRSWDMVSNCHSSIHLFFRFMSIQISNTPSSCRFCRHFTKNILPRWHEWVLDSISSVRRPESIGIPAPDGLRTPVRNTSKTIKNVYFLGKVTIFPLLSGGWRRVISFCQERAVSTSQGCTVFIVWCVRGKGWEPCSTCLTTVLHCCPGWVLSCSDRSGFGRYSQCANYSSLILMFSVCFLLMLLPPVGPAWLWSQIRHLQFGDCGVWACQRQGTFPGHATHSGIQNTFHP